MLKLFNHIHASIPLPPIATGVFCEYVTASNGVFVRSVRPGLEALLLKSLRDKAKQWWYFLDDPSVPPDNNLAER